MITLDTITKALDSKVIKSYEAFTPLAVSNGTTINYIDGGIPDYLISSNDKIIRDASMIGFTYGLGAWHWFKSLGDQYIFSHSYSQNVGRTSGGSIRGFKIERRLRKLAA